MKILQRATVGRSVNWILNYIYFNTKKKLYTISVYVQHESVESGFLIWMMPVKYEIAFELWHVDCTILFLPKTF